MLRGGFSCNSWISLVRLLMFVSCGNYCASRAYCHALPYLWLLPSRFYALCGHSETSWCYLHIVIYEKMALSKLRLWQQLTMSLYDVRSLYLWKMNPIAWSNHVFLIPGIWWFSFIYCHVKLFLCPCYGSFLFTVFAPEACCFFSKLRNGFSVQCLTRACDNRTCAIIRGVVQSVSGCLSILATFKVCRRLFVFTFSVN